MFRFVVFAVAVLAATSAASIPDVNIDNLARFMLDGRIVGGIITDISKHPHQISMRYKSCTTCAFNHRCGGSIINSTTILTAAHCVTGIAANRVQVVAGSNIRNGYGVVVPVERLVYHEDYAKEVSYENDVAILFLGAELPADRYDIKSIELAEEVPANGLSAIVTGWGTTTENGSPSNLLLEVDVPIVSNEICNERYGNEMINDSMLCAGSTSGGRDACQGDSGGPLLVNGKLAGIVSWGYGCARPEYPGVYANVPQLRSWIDKQLSSS